MSTKFAHPLAVCALSSVLLLVGCSGSSGQQGDASAGGEATEEAATEEGATEEVSVEDAEAALSDSGLAAEEEPGLTNKDVAGIYLNDGPSDAIFSVYQLRKNGSFVMRIHGAGQTVERKGTYEIRDGKVYASVPEGASGTINMQGTNMDVSADAIEDAELVIEDGVLTTNDIGKNGVTARKISRKEYQERIDKATELGPKNISVGEEVVTDSYTFTINSFEFQDEVYPSDTSGYYRYWQHEDDHDYLVAEVTYTNNGNEYCTPGYSTAALITIGDNKYYPDVEVDGGTRTDKSYSIDPMETNRVIVVASIPDAARDSGGEIKLTWVFPKDGALMSYYFSNDNESIRYVLTK